MMYGLCLTLRESVGNTRRCTTHKDDSVMVIRIQIISVVSDLIEEIVSTSKSFLRNLIVVLHDGTFSNIHATAQN